MIGVSLHHVEFDFFENANRKCILGERIDAIAFGDALYSVRLSLSCGTSPLRFILQGLTSGRVYGSEWNAAHILRADTDGHPMSFEWI